MTTSRWPRHAVVDPLGPPVRMFLDLRTCPTLVASTPSLVSNLHYSLIAITDSVATADADPLGVDVNVTFDRVGGLDHHINQLKEMVALPLLYPELFKQFGIIPPRGVLFHGPPGTGKTLVARALAASCTNGNTKICE